MEYTIQEISVEICNRLNIPLNGKTTGQIVIKCLSPYHIDNRPSCSISLDKGVFNCFSCGYSGSLKNLYYQQFGRSIYKDMGIHRSLIIQPQIEEQADLSLIPETDFKFTGQCFPMYTTELSKSWVKRRGFTLDLMDRLGIKYLKFGRTVKKSDPTNKEEWRSYSDMAFIPIFEEKELLCFEARQLRTEEEWRKHLETKKIEVKDYKKLLYPKNSSTKTLYQFNRLKKNEPLFLVEGLMDLISLRTNSIFQNSTTTFGRSIKERQFYLLSQFKSDIFYIPNNDIPGISAIQQFKDKDLKNVSILPLPNTVKDVNDILQKKDTRFNSLEDLINFGWLNNVINIDRYDIKAQIDRVNIH